MRILKSRIAKSTLFAVLMLGNTIIYSQTIIKKIRPSDTDSLITTFNTDSNYVCFNGGVTSKNILLVHLPGSYGEPKRATLFGTLAADLGFHSIGLMYPNVPTVGSFCTNSTDADCYEDLRREIVDGVDYSDSISIPFHEGILNRTQKLLNYLNANFPSENWGQYLDTGGNIIFNRVIFSGHSQGGGHAAIIAKYYPLKRAICFSSPKDWMNIPDQPPLWLSTGNWKTPKSSIYAFNHTLDEHINHQLEIWDSLGLDNYGLPVNVDSNAAPYNNTRQLITSYAVPTGDDHACTVQDNKTPKVSGMAVFIPVWTYLLTDRLMSGISNNLFENQSNILMIPNPTSDNVNINLPDDNYVITVYDQTGICVFKQNSTTGRIQIDLKNRYSGLYFVQVKSAQKSFTGKVLKQ